VRLVRAFVVVLAAAVLLPTLPASATLVACGDGASVAAALARIRAVADPCGETRELASLVDAVERCPTARYRICTRQDVARNLFERPGLEAVGRPGTITWNPELRDALEPACEDDSTRPVLRDPVASLVHEIAHAVHDCNGLPAGRLELEAVRLENIYRRAAGLCQRRGYGDEPLPASLRRVCRQAARSSP
jgi:hypothetical protein